MLTAGDIEAMRGTAFLALPDTAIIERLTSTSDGGGGFTEAWAQQGVEVACRVAPLGGGEGGEGGNAGGRVTDETTHVVTLAAETDVTASDRLLIGGVRYEVTLVRTRGAWEISRRVECKEAG
jgi:head-tail adaptor